MPKCSNCGIEQKYLLGPQCDLCDQCLEYMGLVLDPYNYPSNDNTLKDIIKGDDGDGKTNNL